MKTLVIGGGSFGLSIALELRRRSHTVTLVEAGAIPRSEASSTDISKAIRADYGADRLYTEMAERVFHTWRAWNEVWPRPLYHESGFLFLTRSPMQPGDYEYESYRLLTERGFPLEQVTPRELERRAPAWAPATYADGYFNPVAGWAESGEVVRWLAERCRDAGVDVRERTPVERLLEADDGVRGAGLASGQELAADHTVVAAGVWTPALWPELADRMWPVAQSVFHFRPEQIERFAPPRFTTWAADIAKTGWYGFPANADGLVKVANHGPGERVTPDASRETGAAAEQRLRAFLRESLPALAELPIAGSKRCLYCESWDGNFWLDRHPDCRGLSVAAGGSGHGFKFAPLIGEIVADRIEQRDNRFAGRFAWRELGAQQREAARHAPGIDSGS